MAEMQAYKATPRKAETFSYLPAMSTDKIRQHIAYIIRQGWNPGVEHIEAERSFAHYWYMWKLPFFGEQSVDRVMTELDACRRANPGHHVRLVGYDNYAQSQGLSFVVYRA